jgi:SatD family (SatD)
MAGEQTLWTLIGDVIASKRHADRPRLQRRLGVALEGANASLAPVQPLETTAGDEFQGAFAAFAAAARASVLLRLHLLAEDAAADTRYGLGYGEVTVFDSSRSPISQDGPGWWAAREAVERAGTLAGSTRTSLAPTCYSSGKAVEDTNRDAAIEAFLLARDAAIDQMSSRGRRLLLGLLRGQPQSLLAADEGISQSAVSQHPRRSGAFAIDTAHNRLGGAIA